jgi:hypothetical protein
VSLAELVTLALALMGIAGTIFTALSWRRNDTGALVAQQDTLFNELRGMNDTLRMERDELRLEVTRLKGLSGAA